MLISTGTLSRTVAARSYPTGWTEGIQLHGTEVWMKHIEIDDYPGRANWVRRSQIGLGQSSSHKLHITQVHCICIVFSLPPSQASSASNLRATASFLSTCCMLFTTAPRYLLSTVVEHPECVLAEYGESSILCFNGGATM